MTAPMTREQIDAHAALRRSMDDDFRNGTYRTDWTAIHALINGTDALIAAARYGLDLRDAVLALHKPSRGGHECACGGPVGACDTLVVLTCMANRDTPT